MPIEMPKGLPFSVDTWSPSSRRKRHHFLTHAHKDHSAGILGHSSYPIYSTQITKSLILQQFPQLDSTLFVGIEIGETVVIDDPDGNFSVTAFDANHCPGAIMFMFEGNFGNILHTGDCRLTSECLQKLPEKYICKKGQEPKCHLDYLFLDCTFGNCPLKIPSKYSSIRQVISCIWKHPGAPVVYLTCDLLAQDEILVEVSRTFGSKIYVDRINNAECFQALTLIAPEILSEDATSRFQVFEGFTKFYERARARLAEARAKCEPEPLFIRPSAQWYVFEEEDSQRKQMSTGAKKDCFGVWHVCYSSHSSREELEWAMQVLHPKRVVSTTPGCRAMELDYVKKHCTYTRVASDDPLWKLMDIVDVQGESTLVEVKAIGGVSPLPLNLSPPRPPVTLFGRARLALDDSNVLREEQKFVLPIEEQESGVTVEAEYKESMETGASHFCIGSSKGYSESLRRLYRSMNVPVPRPLPSLVKLMKTTKRAKTSFQF